MTDSVEIGFLLVNLLGAVVAIAGALIFGFRLSGRARTLGIVGCLLLILTGLGYTLLQLLPAVVPDFGSYEVFGPISVVCGLLQALGTGLVIVAAVTGRGPAPAASAPPAYPGQPHPGSPPPGAYRSPGSDPGSPPRW